MVLAARSRQGSEPPGRKRMLVTAFLVGSALLCNPLQAAPAWSMVIVHYSYSERMTKNECDQWHREKGWDGCGYNFIISPSGVVEAGRPLDRPGAHCRGHNSEAIGIVFVSKGGVTSKQIDGFKDLHQSLERRFGRLPLRVHKDFGKTLCPGEEITQKIKEMK